MVLVKLTVKVFFSSSWLLFWFKGKSLLRLVCFRHFREKSKHLFVSYKKVFLDHNPLKQMDSTHNCPLRSLSSTFFGSFLIWCSVTLLMNSMYISSKSSLPTPRYFNFVIIESLDNAFMEISLQFLDQDISSDIQIPNNLVTDILSIFQIKIRLHYAS